MPSLLTLTFEKSPRESKISPILKILVLGRQIKIMMKDDSCRHQLSHLNLSRHSTFLSIQKKYISITMDFQKMVLYRCMVTQNSWLTDCLVKGLLYLPLLESPSAQSGIAYGIYVIYYFSFSVVEVVRYQCNNDD